MSREEPAIFTNMCMVEREDGRILVQDRKSPDWPGVTFPGGHVEKGEAFAHSVIREVLEETGLTIKNPQLCGVKQFHTSTGSRYVVFFYKAVEFSGELRNSQEGAVFWIEKSSLKEYQLAEDFLSMYQVFVTDDLSECYYYREEDQWQIKLL